MIKDKIVYYKKELLDSFEIGEIDYLFDEFIGFDYEEHENQVDIINNRDYRTSSYPIELSTLLKNLIDLNSNGATHVSIEYHVDHVGYMIDAWKVSDASEEEIHEYLDHKEDRSKELIQKKKQELEKELKELEEKLK